MLRLDGVEIGKMWVELVRVVVEKEEEERSHSLGSGERTGVLLLVSTRPISHMFASHFS